MKKALKITLIILGILILITLILFAMDSLKPQNENFIKEDDTLEKSNMSSTIRAVVVKVNEKGLYAIGIENVTELFYVGFSNEGNIGFKQGQEILIYFDGMVLETYPAQLGKVGKIEILKEKSDISIPDSVLRFCYSLRNNVNVTVSELTNSGILLTITDTNELPYNYSNKYIIYKKVKNEDYTGIGYKIGEDTKNSIAGYTRNWS